MSLLRISNSFRNWMIVWGMLIVGHVAGLLLYCGLPTAYESVWLMVMLPISAIAFAAIGPLSIVLFFLTLFRVQGGTTTAIFSLVCCVPLLCWALFVLVRKMMKAKHRLHLRVAIRMFKHMSNSISYSHPKWDLWMAAVLVCVAVMLGIYPADRTVWCVEMVWAVVMGCVRTLPNGLDNLYFSRRIDAAAVLNKAGTNQPNQNCLLTALSKL